MFTIYYRNSLSQFSFSQFESNANDHHEDLKIQLHELQHKINSIEYSSAKAETNSDEFKENILELSNSLNRISKISKITLDYPMFFYCTCFQIDQMVSRCLHPTRFQPKIKSIRYYPYQVLLPWKSIIITMHFCGCRRT